VVLDRDASPAPGSLAGKVAIFDVPLASIANRAYESIAYRVFDPAGVLAPDGRSTPWQPGVAARQALDALQGSGAVAAVGIIDLPSDAAQGGYFPYDGVVRSVPGVYVDRSTGGRLKAAVAAGASARVTLQASVRSTSSRNLLGVIPGASDELVVLNSHTDGPNAIEDNGPNAIVAISQYLTRLPRRALPRTILVSLTTGHFHGGAGQRAFVGRHRRDLVPRAVAALTVEHLGALEWEPGPDGATLTGHNETALFFAVESTPLVRAAYAAAAAAGADPALVARPITDAPGAPDGHGFPAEGNQLWTEGGIPTANFITGPIYLFNWGVSTMDKFDATLMRRQALAFAQMLLDLAHVPRKRLRRLDLLQR
jgi:hypothetical protein